MINVLYPIGNMARENPRHEDISFFFPHDQVFRSDPRVNFPSVRAAGALRAAVDGDGGEGREREEHRAVKLSEHREGEG